MAQEQLPSAVETVDKLETSQWIPTTHEPISKKEKARRAFTANLGILAEALREVAILEPTYTPQANYGIGPVKYDTYFSEGEYMEWDYLVDLNSLLKSEKMIGDALLKSDAEGMALLFGREDPLPWIPAAQRVAIRYEMQERTTKELLRNKYGVSKDFPSYDVYTLVRHCEEEDGLPDEGSLGVIARLTKVETDQGEATEEVENELINTPMSEDECNVDQIRNLFTKRRAQQKITTASRKTLNRIRFYRRCDVFGIATDVKGLEAMMKKEVTLMKQKQLNNAVIDKMVAEILRRNDFQFVECQSPAVDDSSLSKQKQLDDVALYDIIAEVLHRNGIKKPTCSSEDTHVE